MRKDKVNLESVIEIINRSFKADLEKNVGDGKIKYSQIPISEIIFSDTRVG